MENNNLSKNNKTVRTAVICGMMAVIAVAVVLIANYASGASARQVAKQLSMGNRYLNEMAYEDAIVQFQGVLEIEPNNTDALLGLMDAAFAAKDSELLKNTVMTIYKSESTEQGVYVDNEELVSKLAVSVYSWFESEEDYAAFIDNLYEQTESESLIALKQTVYEKLIYQLWLSGKYEEALTQAQANYDADPENDRIKTQLQNLLRGYAYICYQQQKYEKAVELLEQYKNFAGEDEAYSRLKSNIQTARENDDEIQKWVDEFYDIWLEAYEAYGNDYSVEELMEQNVSYYEKHFLGWMSWDEWLEATEKINRVYYSSNLLESVSINGRGIGVYKIKGKVYLYCGFYENGKRAGRGDWWVCGFLNGSEQYKLTWEDDIPNGPGMSEAMYNDRFETMGFQVNKGVYEGDLKVQPSFGEKWKAVAGFDDGYETTSYENQPGRKTVEGIDVIPDSYEFENEKLLFN